jgi:hypothetical protein
MLFGAFNLCFIPFVALYCPEVSDTDRPSR